MSDPVSTFDDAASDTTHANRPTLTANGTFTGRFDNRIDPVYGYTDDRDFFQIDIYDGYNDGPGSIMPGTKITFEPVDAYFFSVGFRLDRDSLLDQTSAYPGSTGTLYLRDPIIGTISNTYTVPTQRQLDLNAYLDDLGHDFVIEFSLRGGGPPLGGPVLSPLDYVVSFSGPKLPSGPIFNYRDFGSNKNFYDLHTSGSSLSIHGGRGTDFVWGGQQADTLYGGLDRDIVIGDNGDDLIVGDDSTTATAGQADQLLGGGGNDTAYGGGGNDYIHGEWGDDTLYGGNGNDWIHGGYGSDTVDGGAGNDYIWGASYFGEPGNPYSPGDWFGAPILVDFDGRTGRSRAPQYWTISGENQSDDASSDTLSGGDGNDLIAGDAGNDILDGGRGNDWLDGGTGVDQMTGGLGNDTFIVDNAGDMVFEALSGGTDTVRALITYALGDNLENLTIIGTGHLDGTGNAARNTLTGNDGNNLLDGGLGADKLVGGKGDDTYIVDNAADRVTELADGGKDTVRSSVSHTLAANVENLQLTGSLLVSGVGVKGTGNALDNRITGNDLANALSGMTGNDTLIGGLGTDTLTGGTGADTFLFLTPGDGGDIIKDFSSLQGDKIGISAAAFGLLGTGPLGVGLFEKNSGGGATSGGTRFVYDTTLDQLFFDADGCGTGAAMLLATFTVKTTELSAGDLVLA